MDIVRSESPSQQQTNRVSNILVRYCGSKELRSSFLADKDSQHPEDAYLVKYFPKYYHNLALVIKRQHSLSSKIKMIKRLRRFSGDFNRQIPQVNWFKILGNSRKGIEEFPQMNTSFWAPVTLRIVKFFLQITRLHLPTDRSQILGFKQFLVIWRTFSKYLRNMRRLRVLEVDTFNGFESLLKKLNGMPRLLENLKVLKYKLSPDISDGLGKLQNILPSLTNLHLLSISSKMSPIYQTIPQACKNLTSLSLEFKNIGDSFFESSRQRQKFPDFITPIQKLPQLQHISISWSGDRSREFWSYFIPPTSLKSLKLRFPALDMIGAIFPESFPMKKDPITLKNLENYQSFLTHWKDIKELEAMEFQASCENAEEILFMRSFITVVLKKVSKLTSLKCHLSLKYQASLRYEPFVAEEAPHLYGHLQKFEMKISLYEELSSVNFDFGFLKPFKNLRSIDFQGNSCSCVNVEDAICLLEENNNNGELLTFRFGKVRINYKEELKEFLKRVSNVKKSRRNFKIILALEFRMEVGDDEVQYLESFCKVVESNKTVKGLEISLDMYKQDFSNHNIDGIKRVLEKYPGLRNFTLNRYGGRNLFSNKLNFLK